MSDIREREKDDISDAEAAAEADGQKGRWSNHKRQNMCRDTFFLCGNICTMIEIIIAVFGAAHWPICHVPEAAAEDAIDASEEAEDEAVSDGCDMRAFAPTTRRVGCPRFDTGGVAAADTTCELACKSIGCVGMHASNGGSTHSLPRGAVEVNVGGCGSSNQK